MVNKKVNTHSILKNTLLYCEYISTLSRDTHNTLNNMNNNNVQQQQGNNSNSNDNNNDGVSSNKSNIST